MYTKTFLGSNAAFFATLRPSRRVIDYVLTDAQPRHSAYG
jgi:hypothetical protein